MAPKDSPQGNTVPERKFLSGPPQTGPRTQGGHRLQDLAVNLEGSPDVYETLVVYPPQGMEQRGILALVGELRSAPSSSRYLLSLVGSTLRHAYYSPESPKKRDRFSEALDAVNEALAREAREGQDQWYGNLSLIALAILDDQLLVATAGAAKALLIRDGIPRAIEAQAESVSAAFSAVAVGNLKRGDEIAVLPASNLQYVSDLAQIGNTSVQGEFLKKIRAKGGGALLLVYAKESPLSFTPRKSLTISTPDFSVPQRILKNVAASFPDPMGLKHAVESFHPIIAASRFALPKLSLPRITFRFASFPHIARVPKFTPRIAIPAFAIAMVILTLILWRTENSRTTQGNAANVLSVIQQKIDEADAASILGKQKDALAALHDGATLLAQIPEGKQNADAKKLGALLSQKEREIEKIQPLAPSRTIILPSFPVEFHPQGLSVLPARDGNEETFVLADPTYAGVWRISSNPQKQGSFVFLPEALQGGIAALSPPLSPQDIILIATTEGIGEMNRQGTIETVTPFDPAEDPQAFAALNNDSLLLISPKTKTIFAVTKDPHHQTRELTPWSRNDAKLTGAKDIAIAQIAYVLTRDHTLLKFSKGRRIGEITPKNPLGEPIALTHLIAHGNNLIGLDRDRGMLVGMSSDGRATVQYANDELKNTSTITVGSDGRVFALNPKTILEFTLPGN